LLPELIDNFLLFLKGNVHQWTGDGAHRQPRLWREKATIKYRVCDLLWRPVGRLVRCYKIEHGFQNSIFAKFIADRQDTDRIDVFWMAE